jgi:phosphopantothenoylcysteine decarboxylase/phosphopantothenate--cysteine ligase
LNRKIRLIRFKFFEELKEIIIKELRSKKYAAVLHSAAVCDYAPAVTFLGKVKSDRKIWNLGLVPTAKIIDLIKKIDRSVFLVGFKFEPGAGKNALIKRTRDLMLRAGLDLAVANTIDKGRYRAYILGQNKIRGPSRSKIALVNRLINVVGENL